MLKYSTVLLFGICNLIVVMNFKLCILLYLYLSCLALPCLALPCLALPCLALPCLVVPYLALPCLTLPCLALPYLALPWSLASTKNCDRSLLHYSTVYCYIFIHHFRTVCTHTVSVYIHMCISFLFL